MGRRTAGAPRPQPGPRHLRPCLRSPTAPRILARARLEPQDGPPAPAARRLRPLIRHFLSRVPYPFSDYRAKIVSWDRQERDMGTANYAPAGFCGLRDFEIAVVSGVSGCRWVVR